MKQKNILILTILLVVLGVSVLLKHWIQSNDFMVQSSAEVATPSVFSFDPAQIEKILIGRGLAGAPVELAKENSEWRVKSLWNAKADSAKVSQLLEKIRNARGEMRGNSKALFLDFGIRDEEAFSIQLIGKGNLSFLDLRIGMRQAGADGYFFRKAGSEDVYLANVAMSELLGIFTPFEEGKPMSEFWADETLFYLKPEAVKQITVSRFQNGNKITAAGIIWEADPKDPAKGTWKFIRADLSSQLDSDKVLRFIATLNSVKAQKLVDPNGQGYGLDKPVLQISVKEGDKDITLNVGAKDEKTGVSYAQVSGSTSIYQLLSYYVSDLDLDDTRFFKETPPPPQFNPDPNKKSPEVSTPGTPGKAT